MTKHYNRKKNVSHREKQDQYLKTRYGISLSEKLDLLERNSDRCEICKKRVDPNTTTKEKKPWVRTSVVDHCHTTGEVRGILCAQCNAAIGLLQDRADVVLSAYEYLQHHRKPTDNLSYHQLNLPLDGESVFDLRMKRRSI